MVETAIAQFKKFALRFHVCNKYIGLQMGRSCMISLMCDFLQAVCDVSFAVVSNLN
jgi:hypothetical protein